MTKPSGHRSSFVHRHSLSLTTAAILVLWTILYVYANPNTHLGSFYGNAIADWSGVLVTVLATKYLYEKDQRKAQSTQRAG